MIDGGNHVEILGSKFPAVNIQIWPESPELHVVVGFDVAKTTNNPVVLTYGIYFEMMFENGTTLTVHQEAADCANGVCETHCQMDLTDPEAFKNHFQIEEYSKDQTQVPSFVYHASGEDELVNLLQDLKEGNSRPRVA